MFNIGGGELLIILLVALIFLGPTRLPEVARQFGQTVSSLRSLAQGFQNELEAAARPDDLAGPSFGESRQLPADGSGDAADPEVASQDEPPQSSENGTSAEVADQDQPELLPKLTASFTNEPTASGTPEDADTANPDAASSERASDAGPKLPKTDPFDIGRAARQVDLSAAAGDEPSSGAPTDLTAEPEEQHDD